MIKISEDFASFPAEHANRHNLGKDGGRESLAHMIMLPEYGIAGWMYPTITWDGEAKGAACLFGPALDELVAEKSEGSVADGMDFYDFRIGGFDMAIREPHKKVDLGWRGERLSMDLSYEALHPAYSFSTRQPGIPDFFGNDRTEQHGKLKGTIAVDGKTYSVDSMMVRDHSWGARIWKLNQHYKWFHAITEDVCVHVFELQFYGRIHQQGFLFKDGLMHQIISVEHDYSFDSNMMHQAIQMRVRDSAGREVIIDSKTFAALPVDYDPVVILHEAAQSCTIEGKAGVGWCSFCWNRDYLAHAKEYVQKYG